MDTGAAVSLVNADVYWSLPYPSKLSKPKVNLKSVNGADLKIEGCANIRFKIGGLTLDHEFYVVKNVNRSFILGRDWLIKNGVRLYFDLGSLRIGKTYVPMVEDIHIASILRACKKTVLRPQTSTVCYAKHKNHSNFVNKTVEINAIDKCFLSDEPGLMIGGAIAKTRQSCRVPVLLVNNTNKIFKVKRGSIIGKINAVDEMCIEPTTSTGKDDDLQDITAELNVPPEHRQRIEKLISQHRDLFAVSDADLGHTNTIQMKIDTGDHPPIKMKPYRTPLNKRKIVDRAIDDMLAANIIRRSKSPWSFPIVVVDKKDGSKRFCVDFRRLNKVTKTNSWPLPLIDDLLDQLGKASYFTSLDLKSGYWQVQVQEEDKEKTAFTCHRGLFEFNVMPFGLCNAPQIFSELMSVVLQGLDSCALAYLDDILIFSETLEQHEQHIKTVFDRLRKHGLKLKAKKCSFLKEQTQYLGFIIDKTGVKPDPNKVAAIRSLPSPTTVREVRSFIGMCSYYRRFVPNFSKIAEPLVSLTKKYAKFKWNPQCQLAFDYIKDSLTVIPLLSYPDPSREYVLYTDASDTAVGACLVQETDDDDQEIIPGIRREKPLYYLSHKLSDTQTRWSTVEKEAFAIHFALQKLDHYLHNAKFVIRTDHKPLKYLLDAPMKNKKIQLWALGIAGYNCTIEYIPGTENTCADLLSRTPTTTEASTTEFDEPDVHDNTLEINFINSNAINPREHTNLDIGEPDIPYKPKIELQENGELNIAEEQAKDPEIAFLVRQLQQGRATKSTGSKHLLIDDVLYYLTNADNDPVLRLFVPMHYRSGVIKQYHDDNGHLGIDKTFDAIRQKYYWPNLYKELYDYVGKCVICATRNLKQLKPTTQITDVPPFPFAKIGLDLSGPYPKSLSGNKYIVGFVDLLSGWPEAYAVPDKTAATIAHLIIEEIFPRHGAPMEIITDNGTENENRTVKETLEALNISHVKTSYYHPQSNAKVERFHRTLHDVMAKKMDDNLTTWDIHLNQTLAAIRFNVNESAGYTPFYLLYTRDVVLPIDNILRPRRRYLGEDPHRIALEQQHKAFTTVHRILRRSKKRQAKYANRTAVDIDLKVGDPVYYRNNQRQSKLQSRWKPFYRIIEQTSPVTFKIKNQLDGKVTKAHKELLRFAKIDQWEIPKDDTGKPLRKTAYVMPQESESDDDEPQEEEEDVNNESHSAAPNSDDNSEARSVVSDQDSLMTEEHHDHEVLPSESEDEDDNVPLAQLARQYRREREDSSSEDDIPLWELQKRLRAKDNVKTDKDLDLTTDTDNGNGSLLDMDVNACHIKPKTTRKPKSAENKFRFLLETAIRLM